MSTNNTSAISAIVDGSVWLSIGILTVITNITALGILISARHELKGETYIILGSSFVVCILFAIWNSFFVEFLSLIPNVDKTVKVLECTFGTTGIVGLISNINLHLCLISADRYLYVMYPYYYNRLVNKISVTIALIIIWLLPATSILSLVTYREINTENCTYNDQTAAAILRGDAIAATVIMAILVFIPLSVVIIIYIRIFFLIKSHNDTLCTAVGKSNRKNLKAILQMSILIGVFAIMFLPISIITIAGIWLFVLNILSDSESIKILLTATKVCRYIAYSYPCLHPILYCYFTPNIKLEIMRRLYTCGGNRSEFSIKLQSRLGTLLVNNEPNISPSQPADKSSTVHGSRRERNVTTGRNGNNQQNKRTFKLTVLAHHKYNSIAPKPDDD